MGMSGGSSCGYLEWTDVVGMGTGGIDTDIGYSYRN